MPNLSACTIYFEYLLTILIKFFFGRNQNIFFYRVACLKGGG